VRAPVLLLLLLVGCSRGCPDAAERAEPAADRAEALARRLLIVDGHVDLPYRMIEKLDPEGRPTIDIRTRTAEGDFDIPRARAGGLDAPFMSIYVPAKHQTEGGAKRVADQLIDLVETLAKGAPADLEVARSTADVERIVTAGRIALPLGMENGAPLEGRLENLAHFHGRGIRYITLAHSLDNDIADSSYDQARTHGGLSAFGREVVAEMNRLGVMIDISHVSDAAAEQVLALSKAPVIASHSSCRHFTPGFLRNMSDELIRGLAKNGGVIMINFGSTFIDAEVVKRADVYRAARTKFMEAEGLAREDPKVEAWAKAYFAEHGHLYSRVEVVADHIDHVVKLVGVDHVGFGSDFDGVGDTLPRGLEDVSKYPNLLRVLLARGYSETELAKICGLNLMRVWKAVERAAVRP